MNHPHDDLEQPTGEVQEYERFARYRRRLQFCAGPESYTFHACMEHRTRLGQDDLSKGQSDVSCFFATSTDIVEAVDPTDEIECDFCKEG